MYTFVYRHRVRYRECDPMGVVYHAHYIDYFEAARTEALRALGFPYKALEDAGIVMPVIDLAVQYRRSARYDDLLEIACSFEAPPTTRIRVDYAVRRAGEAAVLATGHVSLCFVDTARNRPIAAPEALRALFQNPLVQNHQPAPADAPAVPDRS